MSEPAAPWWAEVQHLRPREDREPQAPAGPSQRFDRSHTAAQPEAAAVATLEREVADPWADEPAWGPEQAGWETASRSRDPWETEPVREAEPVREERARVEVREERARVEVREERARVEVREERARVEVREERARVEVREERARGEERARVEPSRGWDDAQAPPASRVWDDSLEDAFASTPGWADDDEWLLPKGAGRIENGRRTIEIRGQVDRIHGFNASPEPRGTLRSGRRLRAGERFERRPDRVALWAFLLGVLLILVAAFSKPGDADAAVHAAAAAPAPQVIVVEAPAAAPLR